MVSGEGKFAGFASPALAYEDPVPLAEPERGVANARRSILAGTGQEYLLMSGDAGASAVSRIQGRAIHEARLGASKVAVDSGIRWHLETVARWAHEAIGQSGTVNDLRVESNAIIDTGPLTPDEKRAIMEEIEKGLLSKETGMGLLGRDDPQAEMQRIEDEQAASDARFLGVASGTAQRGQVGQGGESNPADILAGELGGGSGEGVV